jgi:hypothetical protein
LFFLAVSVDEVATIHEKVAEIIDHLFLPGGDRHATFFRVTGIWVFALGIPVLSACLWALFSLRSYFARPPYLFRKMLLGVVIYFGGAIGVETLSNIPDAGTLGFVIENFFEELFEMVGITVLFWAALDLLLAHGFALQLEPAEDRAGDPNFVVDRTVGQAIWTGVQELPKGGTLGSPDMSSGRLSSPRMRGKKR